MLYGLPAHDEAVGVARLAAASGRSMEEVLEWGRAQQADYTSTAYRVAARGRIQAPGAPVSVDAAVLLLHARCDEGCACGGCNLARRAQDPKPGDGNVALPPSIRPVQEPLYAEVSSWANPHELGEQLARAAAARKRTLTPEELRAVKQRKKEMKEKKMRAWLAD